VYGQEVAPPFGDRLREALDTYERLTGRRPSMDDVNPRSPHANPHYRDFCRTRYRVTVEPSRGEWIALELGIKPMLRLVVEASDWPELRMSCESRGYATAMIHFPVQESHLDGTTKPSAPAKTDPSVHRIVAFVGRDREELEEAASVDGEMLLEDVSEHAWRVQGRRLGELLGYPPCCVDHFVNTPGNSENIDVIRRIARRSTRFDPLLNNLSMSVVHATCWFPCRYDCAASLKLAREVDRQLAAEQPGQQGLVRRMWGMPRLYFDERRQLMFDGSVVKDRVQYRAVHTPFTFDRNAAHAVLDWVFHMDIARRLTNADELDVRGKVIRVMRESRVIEEIELGEEPVLLPFGETP
jgi:hypothetical protein